MAHWLVEGRFKILQINLLGTAKVVKPFAKQGGLLLMPVSALIDWTEACLINKADLRLERVSK